MTDQIIRSIPLIKRYSRHNLASDLKFASELKQGGGISNSDLDEQVKSATEDVWSKIDCLECGNCCRSLQIVVDDADINLLAKELKLAIRKFHERYVDIAIDKVKHLKSSPCVFLGDDNTCAVYEFRPKACRDFPYVHEKGFRSRALVMLENSSVCPIVFNVWQKLKSKVSRQPAKPVTKTPVNPFNASKLPVRRRR